VLTRLAIRNVELFDEVEIELAQHVVSVGPNSSGKTSALQALALWNTGVRMGPRARCISGGHGGRARRRGR
jgi:predicted ATPase